MVRASYCGYSEGRACFPPPKCHKNPFSSSHPSHPFHGEYFRGVPGSTTSSIIAILPSSTWDEHFH